MTNMINRFKQSEEGLDLIQLLVAVAILGALLAVGVLTLIGKVDSAKNTASDAAVANAVTAAKVVLAEGTATTPPAQRAAILAIISGSDVAVWVYYETDATSVPTRIHIVDTNGASAWVTQAGVVTTTHA